MINEKLTDVNEVMKFYDSYGEKEWNRHDRGIYSRINFLLHMDFIKDYLFPGAKILDAGCGAGRFSLEFARLGCEVTLFDISEEQLRIAHDKISENRLDSCIKEYVQGDIRDLFRFKDHSFDLVVCYGAPLSYVLDGRDTAVKEFTRVVKENGRVFVSVNNKWGILKTLLGNGYPDFFNNPDYWYITEVMETGNLPKHEKVEHPARHFFEAAELKALLEAAGLKEVTLGASPCFCCGCKKQTEDMSQDEKAYRTILQIEREVYKKPSMLDNGEFLLAMGRKPAVLD